MNISGRSFRSANSNSNASPAQVGGDDHDVAVLNEVFISHKKMQIKLLVIIISMLLLI